ncbi:MAG: hypothetical protein ACXVCJ_14330, partial [Polyangiales bacterium]
MPSEEPQKAAPPPPPPPPREEPPPPPPAPKKGFPLRFLILGLIALAIAIGIGVHYANKPKLPVAARAIGARLDLAAGEVIVEENGSISKALSGTPLAIGSRVTTAKGARALVRTGDGASVFLRGETSIVLQTGGISLE